MASAAERAEQAVAAVRDQPSARLDLAISTYAQGRQWCDAETEFMRWEIRRGVLNPLDSPEPGSPWWRAVNERLLRDAVEGAYLHADGSGAPSCDAVARWAEFFAAPSPRGWYRAHNASVVAGYLSHADLASAELPDEQHLMNLTLMRVLYAQALEEDVSVGLGVWAHLGRMLANPRAMGVGDVVRLPDLYPPHYPLDRVDVAALDHRLPTIDDALVALFDDRIVFPRLGELYAMGAQTLPAPGLTALECDGRPVYPRSLLDRASPAAAVARPRTVPERVLDTLVAIADRVFHRSPRPWSAEEAERVANSVIARGPSVHHDLPWIGAQRWEHVLFCSWRVPAEQMRRLVPPALELDLHNGEAWVSLLPLKMAHVHLRDLPGVPELTNFPELNLRTYVQCGGEPGVYFFSLDAPSPIAVWAGRHLFHINYDTARMSMDVKGDTVRFTSVREGADAAFDATYTAHGVARPITADSIEQFLCERYAMFGIDHESRVVRGDIRHLPWLLRDVDVTLHTTSVLATAGMTTVPPPDHVTFSDATDNVVWPMLHVT